MNMIQARLASSLCDLADVCDPDPSNQAAIADLRRLAAAIRATDDLNTPQAAALVSRALDLLIPEA